MRLPPLQIQVESRYVAEQSQPEKQLYLFQYRVTMENRHDQTLTLTHRHWKITDGNGSLNEVSGEGVVGQTPTLAPGESFSYTSAVTLPTPVGSMTGFYTLLSDDGQVLQSPIDRFALTNPRSLH
ncbi:Co2+/Mg2+ efflux protein ApaG [Ferrimonas sediminicola]|uniref:Co2+/Mg2+ efflux protein ApaG n=1 Tax=Ferrimonas sediminicola TaxID=2569538 RepID=A0A4U1BC88_9GAMM|nr:Co2+/Mg2+ efflux protein ApaG [Ferrimonas sediminicola]TKB48072.1 Co2+/Mg2+ efflux protein ApaG [Ferrimonas sediminicola]